ncbi:Uncharacterised protein [Vibrio cholerae]|nr:Uncharacterised protein [Vibrio cholerae]CSB62441.1 Uncharacterised protein [Vibrio cholerae]CSB65331.1 Uncharacterised protein [Vibrio cholerae]
MGQKRLVKLIGDRRVSIPISHETFEGLLFFARPYGFTVSHQRIVDFCLNAIITLDSLANLRFIFHWQYRKLGTPPVRHLVFYRIDIFHCR